MRPLTVLKNSLARRQVLQRMGIQPGELVLEVGSGQNPNPRADVLCDRYLLDHTERNQEAPVLDRPFAVGDIYRLPFQTGVFDFVICSHVLEHLDRPEDAAAELSRVARRGYVEVPSRENELLLPFPFHRWLIDREGETLVFRTKERTAPDPGLHTWFSNLSANVPDFPDLFLRKLHALGNVHGVVWEGAPSVRVIGPPGPVKAQASALPMEEELVRLGEALSGAVGGSLKRRFLDWIILGRRRRESIDLLSLAECPVCGAASLEGEADRWRCRDCGGEYPLLKAGALLVPYLVS